MGHWDRDPDQAVDLMTEWLTRYKAAESPRHEIVMRAVESKRQSTTFGAISPLIRKNPRAGDGSTPHPTPIPTTAPPSPMSRCERGILSWTLIPPSRSAASAPPEARNQPRYLDPACCRHQQPADQRVAIAHRAKQELRRRRRLRDLPTSGSRGGDRRETRYPTPGGYRLWRALHDRWTWHAA